MKNYFSLALLSILSISTTASAQDGYRLRTITPESVFVPSGFDSNDNAQIFLYGVFTDVCHKVMQPKVSIDRETNQIKIQAVANVRDMCEEMYVNIPYSNTINLGMLPNGKYDIMVLQKGAYHKVNSLQIGNPKSTGGVDDFPYAYIDQIRFDPAGMGTPQVTLYGTIPSTCLAFQEMKINHKLESVIDILPILKVRPGVACLPSKAPFTQTISLRISHSTPTLLNVRSAGGKSVTQVVDLRETALSRFKKL